MRVTVTQKHINKGIRKDSNRCPIALAIKERHHKTVSVQHTNCYIRDKKKVSLYAVPDIARHFIINFDVNNRVEPFEFEMTKLDNS